MKKKLFQVLMLLVATVSVGSFVSCKDTNEDLYNELRTQSITDDATLKQALETRIDELAGKIGALEAWKAEIEAWKATIKSCGCPDDVAGLIAGLQAQIDAIDAYTKAEADAKFLTEAQVNALLAKLKTEQIDPINAIIATLAKASDLDAYETKTDAALQTITKTIADLQVALEAAKCECDLTKYDEALITLGQLEVKMANAEADIAQALADASAAKTTAANAENIANLAKQSAESALETAKDAQDKANTAATDAAVAKEIANLAKDLANTALTNANTANTIATQALTLAQANEKDIQALRTELQNNTKELRDAIEKNSDAISDLSADVKADAVKIANNAENIQKNAEAIEKIKDEISQLKTDVTLASADAKQALQDATAAAAKADANEKLIADLTERVKANEVNIENLKESVKTLNETVSGLSTQVTENTTNIKNLQDALKKTEEKVDDLSEKYTKLNADVEALKEQVKNCKETCALNLELAKAEIRTEMQELKNELYKELIEKINENTTGVAVNKQAIEDLQKLHETDVEWIKEALKQLAKQISDSSTVDLTEILEKLSNLEKKDNELDKKIDDLEKTLSDRLTKDEKTVGDLKKDVNNLKTDVKTLQDNIKDAQDKLNDLTTDLTNLTSDVEALQEYLRSQITGLTIQGTYNPMFGSFSIPANIQSNVLIAYYGLPDNKVEFPTTDVTNYIRGEEALTAKDWDMLEESGVNAETYKANKPLINEYVNGDGRVLANAGRVYVTVNPTTVNAKGLELEIVNTQDEASLIKLSPLRKSDATLEFGFSRADNGFYEATAYVAKGDLDDVERPFSKQAIIDLGKEARETLKDITTKSMTAGSTGLDDLAVKLYQVVRTLRLDQSGLKCPFTDVDGNTQAVYSQYNLAATAVKPLGLDWGKDFHYVTIPGYERAEKMLETIYNKLSGVVTSIEGNKEIKNLFKDLAGLNIKHVTLNELNDAFLAKFVVEIDASFTIDDVRYDLVLPVDVWVPVKYAEDLTVAGTALTVNPAEAVDLSYLDPNIASNVKDALFDKLKTQVKKPTVVITNDDSGNLTSVLVVPVNDQSGKLQGFAGFPLETPVAVVSGEIQFDGTGIAMVSGSSVATAGYTQNVNIDQLNYSFVFKGKTFEYKKTIDFKDAIKTLWANVDEAIGDVNDILDKLNNLIKDALALRDLMVKYEGKYTNMVDNYFGADGKLHGYLDKVNSLIVNFVNGINWQLGPFIVAEDVNGFKVLATSKSLATTMENNKLRLYPTSKNLELIVPFARKHVAVTNVFKGDASAQGGDADCLAKLKAANTGDMNQVIDGTKRMVEVNGMESGYVYEIAYSVLDFKGQISTRKTYIKIK